MYRGARRVLALCFPLLLGGSGLAQPLDLSWRSTLADYQRFADEKVQPWREANDNVGRIGGWREYARESSQAQSAAPAASAASQAAPSKATVEPHASHGHQ